MILLSENKMLLKGTHTRNQRETTHLTTIKFIKQLMLCSASGFLEQHCFKTMIQFLSYLIHTYITASKLSRLCTSIPYFYLSMYIYFINIYVCSVFAYHFFFSRVQ